MGGIEGEAIRTLAIVAQGGLLEESDFPLFSWVHGVVRQPGDLRLRFEEFLAGFAGAGP